MEIEAALVVKKQKLNRYMDRVRGSSGQTGAIYNGLRAVGVTDAIAVTGIRDRDVDTYEILVAPKVSASNADFSDACSRIADKFS